MEQPVRVYVDTSVFGGIFDREFAYASRVFFEQALGGRFELLVSSLVHDEIAGAPSHVKEFFRDILGYNRELPITDEVTKLQWAYVQAGVLSEDWVEDALHVAVATAGKCSLIVSWNFRHMVHFEKIAHYNAVNGVNGYGDIRIYSPREVIEYDETV